MALKTSKPVTTQLQEGKSSVNLRASVADNIGVSKFPDTTPFLEVTKNALEVIDTFRKSAEVDSRVEWQHQFNQQSRDHYMNLREKFSHDPDGMKNAVDAYSKTTLANTPPVYRSIAENILAGKNLANMSFASANFKQRDDQEKVSGYQVERTGIENDLSKDFDTIVSDRRTSIQDINNRASIFQKYQNQLYGDSEQALVATGRYDVNVMKKDLEEDIVNFEALRLFAIYKKSGHYEGKKYILNYAAGKDYAPLKPENPNNPIFYKYKSDINNEFTRANILNKVNNLIRTYRGDQITSLKDATKTYDLKNESELGKPMNINNFADGKVPNVNSYIQENYNFDVDSNNYDQFYKKANYYNKIQNKVSEFVSNKTQPYFANEEEKDDFATALLGRHGVNNPELFRADNEDFVKSVHILKQANITPKAAINYLNTTNVSNFQEAGMIKDFRDKLALYNFLTQSDTYGDKLDINNRVLKTASEQSLGSIQNDQVLAMRLNKIASIDYPKHLTALQQNVATNQSDFTEVLIDNAKDKDIITDAFLGKQLLGEFDHNPYSEIFIDSSTTILPHFTENMISGQTLAKWKEMTMFELSHITDDANIDFKSKEGKLLISRASSKALEKMKAAGYGATKHHGGTGYKIVKHPWEQEMGLYGRPLESALIAAGNKLKTLTPVEQHGELFGYKDTSKFLFFSGNKTGEPNDITSLIKEAIDENYKGIELVPQLSKNKWGKVNYKAYLNYQGTKIDLSPGEFFNPLTFGNVVEFDKNLPNNRTQLINNIAEEKYNAFMKMIDGKIPKSISNSKFVKNVVYEYVQTGLEASDYRFYPDFPLINDFPMELRPFAFILATLGENPLNYDLQNKMNDINILNEKHKQLISFDTEIQKNSRISPQDKRLESSYPPYATPGNDMEREQKYRQYVYSNYKRTDLPLTLRTNNYMAVKKADTPWNGEMTDISNEGNTAAIFDSPDSSIRAGVKVMLNHSTLTNNDVVKNYGDEPTVGEILSVYAEDSSSYIKALETKSKFTRNTKINFFDPNQMSALIEFMIEHEMGSDNFNKYYPPHKRDFLKIMIRRGYKSAIASYGGKLGKE